MDKQKYKQIQAGVTVFIGFVFAFSIIRHTYLVAIIGVALGSLVLISSKKELDEVIRDERSAVIQQKSSTMTLSMVTIGLVFGGIAVEELSFRGLESMKGYGYFMAYLAMGIMTLNVFFTWVYGRQLGD